MQITAKQARETLRRQTLMHLRSGSPFGGEPALTLVQDAIYALDPTSKPASKDALTGIGPALAKLDLALRRITEAIAYASQELGNQNGEDLAKSAIGAKPKKRKR